MTDVKLPVEILSTNRYHYHYHHHFSSSSSSSSSSSYYYYYYYGEYYNGVIMHELNITGQVVQSWVKVTQG